MRRCVRLDASVYVQHVSEKLVKEFLLILGDNFDQNIDLRLLWKSGMQYQTDFMFHFFYLNRKDG